MIFRRWDLKVFNNSLFENISFQWRVVAPNTISLNLTAHRLLHEMNHGYIHIVLFHRYATWQKYLIDVWEDMCDVLDIRVTKAPVFSFIYNNFKQYTNIQHPCPFRMNESYYIVANRFNFSKMFVPLLPSGPYRIDATFTHGQERHPFLFMQAYGEISDHRVWME